MSGTQAWRVSPARTAGASASAAADSRGRRGRRDRRGRRVAAQLWSMLHAQTLLDGTAGGPGGVTVVEDDRQRLAARRAR